MDGLRRRPVSTDKLKEPNGLVYNREDQLDSSRLAKTAAFTVFVTVIGLYFFFQVYWFAWDFGAEYLFDYGRFEAKAHALRAVVIAVKSLVAYQLVVFVHRKLLLGYTDEDELPDYN